VINQHFIGRKNRYAYLAAIQETDSGTLSNLSACKDNGFYNCVLKFDLFEEKVISLKSFGETCSGGEVFYC